MEDEKREISEGSQVVLRTGGVAMDVEKVVKGIAHCFWENRAGERVDARHLVADLDIYDGTNGMPEAV
ncbi:MULTISPECIES: hypothetical protein [unclassified Rhizobium]|uniref:hypothetical protein n=1 Tax=unclassified Rhizobium TaxID=2613769 RepID=UPI0007143C18|nr:MULTISPECIES: hypothetical protein [unclassified Rhizobium]KQT03224.1 hypothetical protein ASG42_24765 [Rhizobium sp. Leaf391]KQT05241.1 hypothetical protein ASG50_15250 [Rhizobium sp. Leaf386]KQU08381.1 hypothetical protein ASG68_22595 [Rhizobium sp. Leaf453]